MLNKTNRFWLMLLVLLAMSNPVISATAQTHNPANDIDNWQEPVRSQLQAIYERGEWRGRRFEAEWAPDSSGYFVGGQRNGNEPRGRTFYLVESGEKGEASAMDRSNRFLSPDGKWILKFQNQHLFVKEKSGEKQTQLTSHAGDREIYYREPTWSPDSSHVFYIETDETDVRKRSVLVPSDPSYPGVRENRFARVGEKITKLRVGVVDVQGNETRWLPIESPEEGIYLGQLEWVNENEILVERMSRFRDKREFLLFNIADNKSRTLFSETNDAWVDASQGKNWELIWIRNKEQFIVISEKGGWRQAFLYSLDGKEMANLTPGKYDIIDRLTVDEQGGWFYFNASPNNATQKYLYRVPLDGKGTLERMTPKDQPGTHDYVLSPNTKWAFHTYSTFNSPPVTELVELPSHQSLRVLEENSELRKKVDAAQQSPAEFVQLDIDGGVTMDAWMIKPKDFDPSKKYPVFVYVYGEPHAQTVLDAWGTAHDQFHRVVADLGYLVVSIDNRGTPAPKGAAWRRSVFGSLGPLSTEEQAAALPALAKTRPYVDLSRVAIWGWSGGGSNTLNALLRKPDVYHVGIAVVPKPQPHLYNAWFQEIFMQTREVNPEGYKKAAAINYADGLKGKLLIITGSGETNTHIQIIEGLVDRLVELGKSFDYMVYPNRDHGLSEGAGSTVHVRMLIIRYLMDHLPAGPR